MNSNSANSRLSVLLTVLSSAATSSCGGAPDHPFFQEPAPSPRSQAAGTVGAQGGTSNAAGSVSGGVTLPGQSGSPSSSTSSSQAGTVSVLAGAGGLDALGGSPGSVLTGSEPYCVAYQQLLHSCELVTEGQYKGCISYLDTAEVCERACLQGVSCDDMEADFCDGEGSLRDCLEECVGISPFVCNDGTEIDSECLCDFLIDCPDGEDEVDCDDFEPSYKCRTVNEAVPESRYCDGHIDCSDASDEPGACAQGIVCDEDYELPPYFVCDGFVDCYDEADEPPGCVTEQCL